MADYRDFREELTQKIIKSMERSKDGRWEMPWNKIAVGSPVNPLSGVTYSGMNRLILTMEASDKGLPNKWVTFVQAKEAGMYVKKGEHGVTIEKWGVTDFYQTEKGRSLDIEAGNRKYSVKDISKIEKNDIYLKNGAKIDKNSAHIIDAENQRHSVDKIASELKQPYVKTFTVFNVTQLDNPKPEWLIDPLKDMKEPEKIEKAEEIIKAMEKDGLKFETGGNRAYYRPADDTIRTPDRRQFKDSELLYGTILHEIAHSTGHEKRLNRQFGKSFGDEKYAKEELRAELASYFLSAETGIKAETQNSAAYLNNWIKSLKEDKNEIFKAAKDAGLAVDYIHTRVKELNSENYDEKRKPDKEAENQFQQQKQNKTLQKDSINTAIQQKDEKNEEKIAPKRQMRR